MTPLILYSYPGACSRVTMTALEETGAVFEDRWVDFDHKAQYAEGYLALNRKAKVPALVVGERVLTENPAILHFLHTVHPQAGLLPQSIDAFDSAARLSDLIWCASMLHPMVRQIRAPQKWTTGETAGIREDGMAKLTKECGHIESRLAASPWWYGGAWSILDTYLYWITSTAAKSGFPLADFPAIARHAEKVRSRPAFQRMLEREVAAVAREGMALDPNTL